MRRTKKSPSKRPLTIVECEGRVWVFSSAVEPAASKLVAGEASKHKPIFHPLKPGDQFSLVTCDCPHGKQSGFGRSRCSHVLAEIIRRKQAEDNN